MNQISYYDPSHYIGAQSDLTQATTLNKNLTAQPLRLIGHKEIVNYCSPRNFVYFSSRSVIVTSV